MAISKVILGDKLIKLSMKILGLSNIGGKIYKNVFLLDWNMYECIAIEPIQCKESIIDAIYFFGDVTIKFHIKNEHDTPIWSEFDENTILQVIKKLTECLRE
ncbi:MAG: hypothetical protein PUJ92_05075 [Bacilli bacterium]|nr:hypothetical protein [Bacilli bacterium]MDY5833058.1 hypothetical protein [Candidatus Onthovivens sp.]